MLCPTPTNSSTLFAISESTFGVSVDENVPV